MSPTCHTPRTYILQTMTWHNQVRTLNSQSSQSRAFPPALKRKLFIATGELMIPSLEHGYMLLLVVHMSSCGGGMAVYIVCMNWSTFFPLAIGPVHIGCRQYRGTNPCERGAQCGHGTVGWTQSKSIPPGRQEESLYSNWWVNDTIIRAWLYVVVACRMSSCGGGMAVYTVCMNWFRCFPLATSPVHIFCRQWRGTIKCEHWTGCRKQSKRAFPPGFQKIIQVDETGELMTQSVVHGDILLWVVQIFLWR